MKKFAKMSSFKEVVLSKEESSRILGGDACYCKAKTMECSDKDDSCWDTIIDPCQVIGLNESSAW